MFSALDIVALYGAIVSTISLLAVLYLSKKGFGVTWEPINPIIPIIRTWLICRVDTNTYTIRLTLYSKRGNVIVYYIEQLTRKGFFQPDGSKMTVKDAYTNNAIQKKKNYLFRVDEGIPIPLSITFTLPKKIKLPFKDKTGIHISTSAKNIKKPFNINWS